MSSLGEAKVNAEARQWKEVISGVLPEFALFDISVNDQGEGEQ